MDKVYICVIGTFGRGYYYDREFGSFDEAEKFLESIGAVYVEWDDPMGLCIGWYDETWDILYSIDYEKAACYR